MSVHKARTALTQKLLKQKKVPQNETTRPLKISAVFTYMSIDALELICNSKGKSQLLLLTANWLTS